MASKYELVFFIFVVFLFCGFFVVFLNNCWFSGDDELSAEGLVSSQQPNLICLKSLMAKIMCPELCCFVHFFWFFVWGFFLFSFLGGGGAGI